MITGSPQPSQAQQESVERVRDSLAVLRSFLASAPSEVDAFKQYGRWAVEQMLSAGVVGGAFLQSEQQSVDQITVEVPSIMGLQHQLHSLFLRAQAVNHLNEVFAGVATDDSAYSHCKKMEELLSLLAGDVAWSLAHVRRSLWLHSSALGDIE